MLPYTTNPGHSHLQSFRSSHIPASMGSGICKSHMLSSCPQLKKTQKTFQWLFVKCDKISLLIFSFMKSFFKFPTFSVIKLSDGVLYAGQYYKWHHLSWSLFMWLLHTSQLYLVNQCCSKDLAPPGKRVTASLFISFFLNRATFRHHRHPVTF